MSLLPTIDGRLFRLAQGNAQLPRSLLAACGANVTHARVRDIARQADGTFALTLRSANRGAGAEVHALSRLAGLSWLRARQHKLASGYWCPRRLQSLSMRVCQVRRALWRAAKLQWSSRRHWSAASAASYPSYHAYIHSKDHAFQRGQKILRYHHRMSVSSGLSATLGERGGGRLCCRGPRDAAGAQRRPDADGRRVGAARAAVSAHRHHVCARPTGPRLVWGYAAARCVLPLN